MAFQPPPSFASKALPSTQGEEFPAAFAQPDRNAASAPRGRLPLEGGGKTRHELAPPSCTGSSAHVSRRS